MTLYKGSQKIRDTGSYGVYHGSRPIKEVYHGSNRVYLFKQKTIFYPSDDFQTFVVPERITKLKIECVASKGNDYSNNNRVGGKGGRVQCFLTVTPNQTLYIMVGKINETISSEYYNASDIRTNNTGITDTTSLNSRLIVAGGGGNAGRTANGGDGGGLIGADGKPANGTGTAKGGTQTEGGNPGYAATFATNGTKGQFGLGGKGGGGWGGAGGSGWYGGGGGSKHEYAGSDGGGGAGGSSYTDPTLCTQIPNTDIHTQGYNDNSGYIEITLEA